MRASSGWDQFIRNMNRSLPKLNETIELPLRGGTITSQIFKTQQQMRN